MDIKAVSVFPWKEEFMPEGGGVYKIFFIHKKCSIS